MRRLLIKNASLLGGERRDVLIANGRIEALEEQLQCDQVADVIEANGGALLPGLNDHHIHLAALAVAGESMDCAAPNVVGAAQLSGQLRGKTEGFGPNTWLRATGYCDSVAGEIDAAWLDARVSHCPVRVQHRGGRMWVFNSRALELLRPQARDPLERVAGRLTGRLFEGDAWLRERLGSQFPDLSAVGAQLASYGITGVTDTTPSNNAQTLAQFKHAQHSGALPQALRMMGDASLDQGVDPAKGEQSGVTVGEHKFHLLESDLPDLDATVEKIAASHAAGRNVAFHCVARTELVFTLAAIRAAGGRAGDRIEHASVTPPELLEQLQELGLTVVTQPVFVRQRGDYYRTHVAQDDQRWLYRLKAHLDAGVPLAGSSDAPFGDPNPWLGMHAATQRLTAAGHAIGKAEALSPEQALALYTAPLNAPASARGPLQNGDVADLVLLHRSWSQARTDLASIEPRLTLKAGALLEH